ncbi:Mediator of RNA polymerase II transcription subunit 4 [Elsinoe australis]|uniref:Mediator of RNA polymerase II transcription subunit 4 n=1 Tax=Elsinoe australis TaxID=40998 RepID=A0A2P8A8F3_9PEZI|nr:Mediator of RNA polymerase II transcription subunit 4 [Elsinoe australis]
MLSILQTRYQRVEKALDTLLESITAYNPSIAAADELVAADDDVNDALEELATHHANYSRILTLRATSTALDEQIKSTISTLASTRKTLQSISLPPSSLTTTSPPSNNPAPRPVRVDELLSYAKFISKTTVPPTRTPAAPTTTQAPTDEASSAPAPLPNGLPQPNIKTEPATPLPDASSQPGTAPLSSATTPGATQSTSDPAAPPQQQSEAMRKVLPPEIKGEFIPWPSHEVIKNGGLGRVQGMVERGEDPGLVVLSAEEEAERAEKARLEEESRQVEEEERRERARREGMGMGMAQGRREVRRDEDVFDPDEM